MEILQNIWTALTTPNEGLINILLIPLSFLELTLNMLLFTTILNIEATKKQKYIYVIILSHGVIRPFILDEEEYNNAPKEIQDRAIKALGMDYYYINCF